VEGLVGIVALILIFGPGFYAIKRVFDLREAKLRAGRGDSNKELEALREERKLLQERVENLESIVCNVDYELNLRIAKVAADQSQATKRLPEAGRGDAGDTSGPTGEGGARASAGADAAAADRAARTLTALAGGGVGDLDVKAAAVRAVAAPEVLQVGAVLANRYRIDKLLGRGGMGAVYLAHDEVLSEHVALKMISTAWSHDQRALIERFRREASAARKVSHVNVVRIHDLGETQDGLMYISMEYLPGKTLADLLEARGTLGIREHRDIVGQICDGLGAAHEAGVIHRDLKPQNVLVGERNAVKIIDFGLAKTAMMSGMTATGLMLGTPYYMSPEQVRGREVDARSDIYSLGALSYHSLTGQPPFDGDTPIAIGFAHCSEEPRPPAELRKGISKDLNKMILAALAKDPRDRPQDTSEFRKAL